MTYDMNDAELPRGLLNQEWPSLPRNTAGTA